MPHVVFKTFPKPGGDECQNLWWGKIAALPRKGDQVWLHGKRFGDTNKETMQEFIVESVVFNINTDTKEQVEGDDTTELQIYLSLAQPPFQMWCEQATNCVFPDEDAPGMCGNCGGRIR